MTFKLSQRSLNNLKGVDERLQEVVHYAIGVSKIDFGVICGLRTVEEQKALVAKGASKTMNSKHLTGDAVDLMAFISGRGLGNSIFTMRSQMRCARAEKRWASTSAGAQRGTSL
jgi:uncharacterized protein YcbK (DUF882 family)